MNLHEIEKVLRTLSSQHSNLTEETLLVLLRAGGWEEKTIREALVLFRTLDVKAPTGIPTIFPQVDKGMILPHTEESVVLPSLVQEDRRIEEKSILPIPHSVNSNTTIETVHKVSQVTFETKRDTPEVEIPQDKQPEKVFSLVEREEPVPIHPENKNAVVAVVEKISIANSGKPVVQAAPLPTSVSKKNEFPENLPLKLYEHSPHTVPFSQYRDTVYGTIEEEQEREVHEEKGSYATTVPEVEIDITSTKVSAFQAETKLVILASIMLLTIMLLLGYMYTNGRL